MRGGRIAERPCGPGDLRGRGYSPTMSDLPPPVELIHVDGGEDVIAVRNQTDPQRLHDWLRTAAVVVGAASLVWMAFSFNGVRDADQRQACLVEIQSSMFGPFGPTDIDDFETRLVDRAEECGLPLVAESLRDSDDRDG